MERCNLDRWFVLIAGVLMALGGNADGWRRIATGAMLVVAWFALRKGGR